MDRTTRGNTLSKIGLSQRKMELKFEEPLRISQIYEALVNLIQPTLLPPEERVK
jgi:hypothetical protein